MKTAKQKIKNKVQDMIDNGGDLDLLPVITHIDNLLQKEKQQIIDSNNSGWRTHRRKENQNAEEYYSETFNNND